jgi:hypothetical protein
LRCCRRVTTGRRWGLGRAQQPQQHQQLFSNRLLVAVLQHLSQQQCEHLFGGTG